MKPLLLKGVASAALTLTLVACSSGGGTNPPAGGPNPADPMGLTPITSRSQIVLPLDRYQTRVDEWRLIMDSQQSARVACMARFGFTARPEKFEPELYEDLYASAHLRYGVFDRDVVEQFGYDSGEVPPVEEESPYTDDPTRYKELLMGVDSAGKRVVAVDAAGVPLPEGGCYAEIGKALTAGIDQDLVFLDLASKLFSEAQQELLASEEYVALEGEWAACMAESGYDFTHRWDAEVSVRGEAKERQREMALKDLECGETTNFVARMMALDVAIQERLISENEASLRGALEMKRQLLDNAKGLYR